jgi:hypothetical protein
MDLVLTLLAIGAALLIAIFLAFLPVRIAVGVMARKAAAPIRNFIQRQRDRRAAPRTTPDRRTGA